MHTDKGARIFRQCVAVLTLTAAATFVPIGAAVTSVLFEQPLASSIANVLFVAHVTKAGLPRGQFNLVLWQPDPFTSTGYLEPTSWYAGSKTGFTPSSPSTAQLGFRNQAGTTTAQSEGDTVGAYLNSADLPTNLPNQKMMIAPHYSFPAGSMPQPFGSSTSMLNAEMDLQIPVAVGAKTYVTADFLFEGPNGVRVSYGVKLFHNGAARSMMSTGFDVFGEDYMINFPLETDNQYLTRDSSSGTFTGTPWLGWRHFQWTIDQAQFAAALNQLSQQYPGKVQASDVTKYSLVGVHLNAEFHYSPAPAELGWSMRGMKVWVS